MKASVSILLFGISRDLVGESVVSLPLRPGTRVADLLDQLHQQYPVLKGIRSLLIAVNGEYAELEQPITSKDEIALIPPVSGG